MATRGNSTGREYLRVSVDRSGRQRSTTEQHDDNERASREHGFRIGGVPYLDTGSASRYARKSRDDFDQLMADLAAGRFGADLLVLWESSRGSRQVGEWVELIDCLERRGVRVFVTTHSRFYDPANPRDRRSLLEDAVDSEYESGKTSERARRSAAANAAAGKPHGRVPFGYRRRYDELTRRFIAQEAHPVEAPLVRELFDRIERGHSLRAISREWEARGIRNDSGTPFSGVHLRSLALNIAYAGKRIHDPGRKSGTRAPGARAVVVQGQWPALVPARTWHAVQRILTAPERRKTKAGKARHLLSMIAKCDPCGAPLAVTYRDGARSMYQCHVRGCVRLDQAELDELAVAEMIGYLSREDVHATVRAADADEDAELARVQDEVAEISAELADLAAQVGAGRLSATLAAAAEPTIRARLTAAEEREAALITPAALASLLQPGQDVATRWADAEISTRREVARLLLSPELLGELRVTRSPIRGHRTPATQRIVWKHSGQA